MPSRRRRKKKPRTSICPLISKEDRERATEWVRRAIRDGQCRFMEGDQDFPKHVWYEAEGRGWFGFCINSVAGEYKGWPWKRTSAVRFSVVEWISDGPNRAPEERATLCDLQILISDQNVCSHLDEDNNLNNHITISTYGLVEGLVHDWWRLFGARDDEYRLIRHRTGYALPDVRFRYDGAVFEALSNQRIYQNPSVRFWVAPPEIMTRGEAESTLASFIEATIDRMRKKGVRGTNAELRWNRVRGSQGDIEEAKFCEAAGALGLDPYAIRDADARLIEHSARLFAGEPLIEFLAGTKPSRAVEALKWVELAEKRPRYRSALPDLAGLSKETEKMAPRVPGERSWSLGYRRARAARKLLHLRPGDRLRSVTEIAKRLGSKSFERAPRVDGVRAIVSQEEQHVRVHLRDRPPLPEARVSERFAFVRAIGDAICFPGAGRSVVNDLHEASRQAAGRAFAAEFMAPIDEVASMVEDGKDLAAIADELNVSTELIERQIQNKERIRDAVESR